MGMEAAVACAHDEFHSVTTRYDRERGVLVYLCTCDRCGQLVGEISRLSYRPRFDPAGNDRFLAPAE